VNSIYDVSNNGCDDSEGDWGDGGNGDNSEEEF
jgi:hypothetical protein